VPAKPKPRPPRWQRRRDARPDELVAAAVELFSAHGYAATRLEDVAARAGVSKGTLYLYFENKLELFKAVVRRALLPNLEQAEALAAAYPGSRRELLTHLVRGIAQVIASSSVSGIPKLVISEAGNFPEVAEFYYREVVLRARALLERILEDGARRGEFRRLEPALVWRLVMAPLVLGVIWKHSFRPFESAPLDFDRYVQTHLDVLFNGLAETAP
jgi:AcrR family transcriptional regulator